MKPLDIHGVDKTVAEVLHENVHVSVICSGNTHADVLQDKLAALLQVLYGKDLLSQDDVMSVITA